ncbi:MAG: hypothetical protein PPHEMADM_3172 [uncultured Paraburkholderia sp.]|nr:MAG: hypothetical protein PPHEMADE_3142 [uncultured Paraburkholderia sp.]CAH2929236.1 MAG: hypothetical protein PPHEMADM_3172 [uncultured Paraburkholderia sp.]
MAFKLIEAAEKSWRKIRGAERIEALLNGYPLQGRNPGDWQHTGFSIAGRLITPSDQCTPVLTIAQIPSLRTNVDLQSFDFIVHRIDTVLHVRLSSFAASHRNIPSSQGHSIT